MAKAGWSYAVARDDGTLASGDDGSDSAALDQTAASADHSAASHSLDAAVGTIRLVNDCCSVVAAIHRGDTFAVGPARSQGGI